MRYQFQYLSNLLTGWALIIIYYPSLEVGQQSMRQLGITGYTILERDNYELYLP